MFPKKPGCKGLIVPGAGTIPQPPGLDYHAPSGRYMPKQGGSRTQLIPAIRTGYHWTLIRQRRVRQFTIEAHYDALDHELRGD